MNEELIGYITDELDKRNDKYTYDFERLDFTEEDIVFILEKIDEFKKGNKNI